MLNLHRYVRLIIGISIIFGCIIGSIISLVFISRVILRPKPSAAPLIFPTPNHSATESPSSPISNPTNSSTNLHPNGKIVFVCQIFKLQTEDQICIINADGTGWRRLTATDKFRSFYPSLAPDGKSVVYSSNMDGNFKIFEMDLEGNASPIGDTIGVAPEISPDGKFVVYANSDGTNDMIWVMNRDGTGRRLLFSPGWDPTWSHDSSKILFATFINGIPQLASINLDGSGYFQITNLPFLRGRSDWSPDGNLIVTYSGKPWERELFIMNSDGSNLKQLSPSGGNSQGPSFSPDGQWVAFTAYFDSIGNNNGCEIYIIRIDGSQLRKLTNNSYCDWQPRWGP